MTVTMVKMSESYALDYTVSHHVMQFIEFVQSANHAYNNENADKMH